ncbi:MAG: aerotaxis receptor Aer, partial [Sulfurospirillum sp.]
MSNLHKVLKNTLTHRQIVIPKPKDEKIEIYENSLLITETDKDGIITYANRRFCKVSGYTKEELIGMP